MINTYFASPERSGDLELKNQIAVLSNNPVINGLLKTVGGLLAVLNSNRQIVSINNAMLEILGIKDPLKVFGLRPGEAINCIYSDKEEGGCGTSKVCSTCGAAVSIVSALKYGEPYERYCVATVNSGNVQKDLFLSVRACPIDLGDEIFILLFLHDRTEEQNLNALSRVFAHDINNIVSMIQGNAYTLSFSEYSEKKEFFDSIENIQQLTDRIAKELRIYNSLLTGGLNSFQIDLDSVSLKNIFDEILLTFKKHPLSVNKTILLPHLFPDITFKTDRVILLKVLSNMILNALESSKVYESIRIWFEYDEDSVIFQVWNCEFIPDDIAGRIFQRNFSTKKKSGRGIGTYSMKKFGEEFLEGRISFETSEQSGTIFTLKIPRNPQPKNHGKE